MYVEPKSEAEWRAREDARTLAQAEEIKSDESRLSKAREAANKMLSEEKKELTALSKVAGAGKRISNNSQKVGGDFNVFQKLPKKKENGLP